MKKQNFKDRMHEHSAMEKSHHMHHAHHPHHHLHEEHKRHGERIHHESAMHHGTYKNQVEEPRVPHENHIAASNMGMSDFFGQADPIAHGQSTGPDMRKDDHRIHGQ